MKLNHITILVSNRKKSAEFYSKIFGLPVIKKGKSKWIKIDGQYLHLAQNSGKPTKNTFNHFCISLDNLTIFLKKIKDKKIKIFNFDDKMNKKIVNSNSLKEKSQFFINDPDGNLIELVDSKNKYFL